MKKFLISVFLLILVSSLRVNAKELTYSDWSLMYPSGLDEVFIESEDRYHFYKVVDNKIEYTSEYYVELDGYIKDEKSKRTFYRYITNNILAFDSYNRLIINYEDYCKKNYCYVKIFKEPTMVDLTDKIEEPEYSIDDMFEIDSEVTPVTGDNIIISFVLLAVSLLTLLVLIVKKKRNVSHEEYI